MANQEQRTDVDWETLETQFDTEQALGALAIDDSWRDEALSEGADQGWGY